MSGTIAGGLKAARANIEKYGKDFYKIQGAKGGRNGHTGGFAANPELAKAAGAKGGRISRRGVSIYKTKVKPCAWQITKMYVDDKLSCKEIARQLNLPYESVRKYVNTEVRPVKW